MLKHFDYFKLCKAAYRGKAMDGEIPAGWDMVGQTYDNSTGYNGFAMANPETNELVIASAGHVLFPQWHKPSTWVGFVKEWVQDSMSALSMAALKQEPAQFQSLVTFIESIRDKGYHDYDLTLTGHSMGAGLSDLGAVKYNAEGVNVRSIGFEGIGSKDVAINMFGDEAVQNAQDKVMVYNLAPNWFTKCAGQAYITPPTLVDEHGKDSYFNFAHGITSFYNKFNEDGDFIYNASSESYRMLSSDLYALKESISESISAAQDAAVYAGSVLSDATELVIYNIGLIPDTMQDIGSLLFHTVDLSGHLLKSTVAFVTPDIAQDASVYAGNTLVDTVSSGVSYGKDLASSAMDSALYYLSAHSDQTADMPFSDLMLRSVTSSDNTINMMNETMNDIGSLLFHTVDLSGCLLTSAVSFE